MTPIPPENRRPYSGLVLLALLTLIAGLLVWALIDSPPGTPNPAATAIPDAVPGAAPPATRP